MNLIDNLLLGVMAAVILVISYYFMKLVKSDPTLLGAMKSKDQWTKIWHFSEKMQPEENKPILSKVPKEEEEKPATPEQ